MRTLAPRGLPSDDLAIRSAEGQDAPGAGGRGFGPSDESSDLTFHTRRRHHKSRLGCVVCKKRRVKCDEKKPSCERCEYRGATCVYEQPERITRKRKSPSSSYCSEDESVKTGSPTDIMTSATAAVAETTIEAFLQPNSLGDGFPSTEIVSTSASPRLVESLRHFDIFTSHTLGAPLARSVMRSRVLPLALSAPYLMHALIATSVSHIRHLQPINHNATRVSEAYHWQQAIRLFRNEISSPVKLEDMDSVLSGSMLLAVLAYTSESHDLSASWVFSPQAENSWLFVQGGFHVLVDKFSPTIANSIWMPVMRDANDFTGSEQIQRPGGHGIIKPFANLCDIDDSSDSTNNPYHGPLRIISALLRLDLVSANFAKFVFFLRTIRGDYGDLLKAKDPRALLILSYWFAILCKLDQWWIRDRARLECRAACMFLEKSDDTRIVDLLEFPAEACGYTLMMQEQRAGLSTVDRISTADGFQDRVTSVEYDTP